MAGFTLKAVLSVVASAALGLAYPATDAPTPTAAAVPCTTGDPVVTAGYTINYAPAIPTAVFEAGYQPEPVWAKEHVVGTYVSTFLLTACVRLKAKESQFD